MGWDRLLVVDGEWIGGWGEEWGELWRKHGGDMG